MNPLPYIATLMTMPLQVSPCFDPTYVTESFVYYYQIWHKCLSVITMLFSSGILAAPFSVTLTDCNLYVILFCDQLHSLANVEWLKKNSTEIFINNLTTVNFSADNIWNGLDTSLRNAESLPAFKRGLSKIIFDS